jgi:hypothetical protein
MIRTTLGTSLLAALFLATPALSEEATIGRSIEGGSRFSVTPACNLQNI